MSVRAISWVWDHSQSCGNDRLVLLAIADCANDEGRQAWPAIATLARKTRLHIRTVERCLHRLRYRYQELTWTSRDGHSNTYQLNKILWTSKQLEWTARDVQAAETTPGNLPGVTPGDLPPPPRQFAAPPPGNLPDDPYVRTRTGTVRTTAAMPPRPAKPPGEAAQDAPGEEIAAANGGHVAVLRKVAWERLTVCFGNPDTPDDAGTRAADCPATLTALIEWLGERARELRIPASSEQIIRAAKSMWKAHAEQTFQPLRETS